MTRDTFSSNRKTYLSWKVKKKTPSDLISRFYTSNVYLYLDQRLGAGGKERGREGLLEIWCHVQDP